MLAVLNNAGVKHKLTNVGWIDLEHKRGQFYLEGV